MRSNDLSDLPVIYARLEPTTDRVAIEHGLKDKRDVVLHYGANGTGLAGRWPWHYSNRPKKSHKTTVLNGITYRLRWLPNLERKSDHAS